MTPPTQTLCIQHESGTFYTTATDVNTIVNTIQGGGLLDVWWFASTGQRFSETMWFNPEALHSVRTERDDG